MKDKKLSLILYCIIELLYYIISITLEFLISTLLNIHSLYFIILIVLIISIPIIIIKILLQRELN